MAVAKKYQGQPVALVAVNSGSSPQKVADYAKKNKITIPVIIDSDRSLERSARVGEISLKNIYQAVALKPDGNFARGSARDLEKTMEQVASDATWNVDPAIVPESMKPLWQSIEFGGFAGVARPLTKMLKSRKPAEKSAANKLNEYVQEKLKERLDNAEADIESDGWSAWKQFREIKTQFKGFSVPKSVDTNIKKLDATEEVKSERAALKQFDLAKKVNGTSATAMKRARRILGRIVEKYPNTEAGRNAKAVIEANK